jgi:hypothetical protein
MKSEAARLMIMNMGSPPLFRHARYASKQAIELRNTDSTDIFTERSREASTNGSGSSRRASKQAVEQGWFM